MQTKEFIQLLENNPQAEVAFEYAENSFVPSPYHITEIKNVHVDSVDCGGNEHSYKQTQVQLWVKPNEQSTEHLTGEKVMKIFNIVNDKKPLMQDTEIFFEFGNEELPISNYSVSETEINENKLTVRFYSKPATCKPLAIVEGEACVPGKSGCC